MMQHAATSIISSRLHGALAWRTAAILQILLKLSALVLSAKSTISSRLHGGSACLRPLGTPAVFTKTTRTLSSGIPTQAGQVASGPYEVIHRSWGIEIQGRPDPSRDANHKNKQGKGDPIGTVAAHYISADTVPKEAVQQQELRLLLRPQPPAPEPPYTGTTVQQTRRRPNIYVILM
ncbi:hypothetical protein QBC46DRAFT_420494 [Diplogelasinospora grovesii]|uniref:Uncharacterized protein n=1 Tax=Diplogelasinospora grovesii TaxID=303347 RepID=A0AAN6N1C4_9PEZI|nr:hypothetical protein QBC46DRAFT_420494 [Diplogelasinospora grovesii]